MSLYFHGAVLWTVVLKRHILPRAHLRFDFVFVNLTGASGLQTNYICKIVTYIIDMQERNVHQK